MSKEETQLLTRIDEVLHYLWDPLGVSDIPEARDEYSSYARVVFSLIERSGTESEIVEYLRKIRIEHMGVGLNPLISSDDEIVQILLKWDAMINKED